MYGRHPDIEEIKNVVPRKGSIEINTNTWPDDKRRAGNYTEDPMKSDFKWAFWCNIFTDNDFSNLENTYNKVSNFASYFYPNPSEKNQKWITILNKYESNTICKEAFKKSIETIIKDIEESDVVDEDKEMFFRILFTIYQDNGEYGTSEWYINGEIELLKKLKFIAQLAKPQNIEVMLYILFKHVMFDCGFKPFFFPCKTITYNLFEQKNNTYYYYNYKNIAPCQFVKFFFISMLLKIRPRVFINLTKKNSKFQDTFFTSLVNQADKLYNKNGIFPCQTANNTNFQRMIGDLIVSKNMTSFFSYIISYWKTNAIKSFEMTGPEAEEEVKNIMNALLSKPIYSSGYHIPHYNQISSSLVKKKTMKTFVKLAKKSFKPTTKDALPKWKYPRTFFERIVKKIKQSLRNTKRLTLKKTNVTVYYPGIKNKNKTVKITQ
tara:strand:+ start:40 stop:1341 length:1302 start_codon:yes stop_codon:yes gene_type:complete